MSSECNVIKTPVGIEWYEGFSRFSNMPKPVMVRKSENDNYVKFDPLHDDFPERSAATIEVRANAVYATIPALVLADLPITERMPDEYDMITNPESGDYYMFTNPVNVVFRNAKGDGFRVYHDMLYVLNPHDDEVLYNPEMFDVPRGASVHLYIKDDGSVCIDNAFQYIKKMKSHSAISLLANRLFGRETASALGAASVVVNIISKDDLTDDELEEALQKYFSTCASDGFSGSPQGAYKDKLDRETVCNILFGPTLATYLSGENITHVVWDHDSEVYMPWDGNVNLYQRYSESYASAEPVNVMEYLYSEIGDKVSLLPRASIDDCVTKADCDKLLAMLSSFM